MENAIQTRRLVLKAVTAETMSLAIEGRLDALGAALAADIPKDWPPLLDDN
jgi:hypothetical protein